MNHEDSKLGAGILGMFAAIKICREQGIDPQDLLELMLEEVFSPDGYAYRPEYDA